MAEKRKRIMVFHLHGRGGYAEVAKSNAAAVRGMRAWMHWGDLDRDHGWSMCEEMPQGF